MRPSRPKLLCKFKQTCRNYKQGKECNYSHDKCMKGSSCPNIQNCMFFHQPDQGFKKDFKKDNKFEKPKNETQCRFGMRCNKRMDGTCGFKHTDTNAGNVPAGKFQPMAEQRPIKNKAQIQCRFGQRCTAYPLGKCSFKHEFAQLASKFQQPRQAFQHSQQSQQQRTQSLRPQNHKSIFDRICIDFLCGNNCNESCQKLHEFSQTKSISKIFSLIGCQREIKKILVMQPYQPDQQPLYIIICHKKVAFGQLTNLARETGNDNIGSSTLVLKRCYDKEILFEGQEIENAWITKIQQNGQRTDILVCKCSNTTKIVLLNRNTSSSLPTAETILNIITIDIYLIILFKSGKSACLEYSFSTNEFQYKGEPFSQAFTLIKKYNKRFNDEEIAAGVIADGLCFINKQLKTYHMKFNEKVNDIAFTQFNSVPFALVLTQVGKLFSINLISFEPALLLQACAKPNPEVVFSCLILTNQHLFIGVDSFGVLVYNIEKYDKPLGIIGLDSNKWKIENDQRGNLILISENQRGRRDVSIFKVRKS